MLATCVSTVFSPTTRRSAIPPFERPSAISASTSRSRAVSVDRAARATATADERRDDRRVDDRPAARHPSHGVSELVDIGDPILQQVADAAGPVAQQPHGVTRISRLGEDQDTRRSAGRE